MLIAAYIDTKDFTHSSPRMSIGTGLDTFIDKVISESPQGAKSFNMESIGYRNSGENLETTYRVYYYPNRGGYYQC